MRRLVVKLNTVPVRVKSLREAAANAASVLSKHGVSGFAPDAVTIISRSRDDAWAHLVAAREDVVAALWRGLLVLMRSVTEHYAELVASLAGRGALGPDDAERVLAVYADLLAYLLRWPLYLHVDPDRGLYSPHVVYPVARLLELAGCRVPGVSGALRLALSAVTASSEEDIVKAFGSAGCGVEPREALLIASIASVTTHDALPVLELALYTVPADTRLGPNSSPLLLHSVLSAAVTHAMLWGRAGSSDLVVARLAALLHDIGKPLDYERHVEASLDAAKALLAPLRKLPGELGKRVSLLLDSVLEIISAYHAGCDGLDERLARLCRAVRDADHVSSAVDRVSELVVECGRSGVEPLCGDRERRAILELARLLAQRLGVSDPVEALERAYTLKGVKDKRAVWHAWWSLYADALLNREVGEAVAEAAEALAALLTSPLPLERGGAARAGDEGVCVAVFDIAGVQKLIFESSKLRVLSGMSTAIDYATMVGIALALGRLGVPPEAIVFAGGASAQAIVPCGLRDVLRSRFASGLEAVLGGAEALLLWGRRLGVRLGTSPLPRVKLGGGQLYSYSAAVAEAHKDLARHRLERAPQSLGVSVVVEPERLCTVCGRRPALKPFTVAGEAMCPVCYARYQAFELLGYRFRREKLKAALEEHGIDARSIGIDEEPTTALTASRGSELAIVKLDGNAMGVFMASSLTPAVYFEKSVRIDMAMKKALRRLYTVFWEALERAAKEGRRAVAEYSAAVLAYSLFYAGGDDAMLVLPHDVALPAAALVVYVFGSETGFKATASAGVAAGPKQQPIWWLVSAAAELLDTAKEFVRGGAVEAVRSRYARQLFGGAVAYDYTSAGALTPLRAKTRLGEREHLGFLGRAVKLMADGVLVRMLWLLLAADAKAEKLVNAVPRSVGDDKAVEELLVGFVRDVVEARALSAQRLRMLERVASKAHAPAAIPFVLVASMGEQGVDEVGKRLLVFAAETVQELSRRLSSSDAYRAFATELYLASKLSGG